MLIELDKITRLLDEIREFPDLKDFQVNECDTFCKKWQINPGQLNFCISVVAAERIKEDAVLQKRIVPQEKEYIEYCITTILENESPENYSDNVPEHSAAAVLTDFAISLMAGHSRWWMGQYQKRLMIKSGMHQKSLTNQEEE